MIMVVVVVVEVADCGSSNEYVVVVEVVGSVLLIIN